MQTCMTARMASHLLVDRIRWNILVRMRAGVTSPSPEPFDWWISRVSVRALSLPPLGRGGEQDRIHLLQLPFELRRAEPAGIDPQGRRREQNKQDWRMARASLWWRVSARIRAGGEAQSFGKWWQGGWGGLLRGAPPRRLIAHHMIADLVAICDDPPDEIRSGQRFGSNDEERGLSFLLLYWESMGLLLKVKSEHIRSLSLRWRAKAG